MTGGSVTTAGIITIAGNASAIGTAVSIILTPTLNTSTGGRVLWGCSTNADSTQWKYVPAECRH